MSDGDWRASIRWVVAHPTEPRVLLDRRGGGLALPAAERPGRVWTGDPAELLPSLHELLGADAVLLRCLEEDEDPPAGMAWLGRGWFDQAAAWLAASMERIGRPLTGPVRHRAAAARRLPRPPPGAAGRPRRPAVARPRRPPPGERGQGAAGLPVLRLDRRLCGPPVPRPGDDPARHFLRRGGGRGRAAAAAAAAAARRYLAEWTSFEPPDRLARAWELALPLGALHQAVSYRSIVARLQPPVDRHIAGSTAWWLRRVLADLPA
jgi:hypothetical protein